MASTRGVKRSMSPALPVGVASAYGESTASSTSLSAHWSGAGVMTSPAALKPEEAPSRGSGVAISRRPLGGPLGGHEVGHDCTPRGWKKGSRDEDLWWGASKNVLRMLSPCRGSEVMLRRVAESLQIVGALSGGGAWAGGASSGGASRRKATVGAVAAPIALTVTSFPLRPPRWPRPPWPPLRGCCCSRRRVAAPTGSSR